MCGIFGLWQKNISEDRLRTLTHTATNTLQHRGPDAQKIWVEGASGIGLGHSRLSIIDLSEAGTQPMSSPNGDFTLVYNGEIYNSKDLRFELEAEFGPLSFRGYSDTETILYACIHWGVNATAQKLIGMFAFGIWDNRNQTLTLVRDRIGIKPLYWAEEQGVIQFASELKAIMVHPAFNKTIDYNALSTFFRYNYIPAPYSIFKNVHKLQPGTILTINQDRSKIQSTFWNMQAIAKNGQEQMAKDAADETEILNTGHTLLKDAVKRRMIADVPLGAFLSGGIDSSLVVALMQTQSSQKIKTFSIGVDWIGYDEAENAAQIARHLGTDHHELYIRATDILPLIPSLPTHYDEPFADSSQIPTMGVSKFAKEHVSVSLSGDGGDELFTGYERYFHGDKQHKIRQAIPPWLYPLLKSGANAARHISPYKRNTLNKVYDILKLSNDRDLFNRLVSVWQHPDSLILPQYDVQTPALWDQPLERDLPNFMERMQYLDAVTYLPDDILTKVDRASMAFSLEVRVPLLDHRLVEFAFGLNRKFRVRNSEGKWFLRTLLEHYIPKSLFNRPKQGFGIPIGHWLKNDLREWVEELLAPHKIKQDGILNNQLVQETWRTHLNGKANNEVKLWTLLMFLSWKERWLND